MSEHLGKRKDWLIIAAIVVGVLTLVMCAVIMLVLTGIIAEPETVFNNIGRLFLGH